MLIHGRDCFIAIKTDGRETGIPYAVETIREAVSLLTEEAAIEGEGTRRAIKKSTGVTGCVVTPLAIGTAPLLLYLAMGKADLPQYVSGTRNLYRYKLALLPMENSTRFDVVQFRGGGRKRYERCAVSAFELRVRRGEAVRLKLNVQGGQAPEEYPGTGHLETAGGERFMGDRVSCRINGAEYTNIYGLTLSVKKEGGTKTELRIKRVLNQADAAAPGGDLPEIIDELSITANLLRDRYEERYYGMFRVTLGRLALAADETIVESADAVIGSMRYYCAGAVIAEVFTADGGNLE
ncbi:MAG: hypothetical protein LBP20_05955 [Treponema sp.]|jgi:hypothetical protein|nr:hypothetical protein [Treponema sp.]